MSSAKRKSNVSSMLAVKKKTLKLRTFLASKSLRVLTPTFYKIAKDSIEGLEKAEFPRPSTRLIRQIYGKQPLVGIEIGTGLGTNALNLLSELNIDKLYCIDPFVPYLDGTVGTQTNYLANSEKTIQKLAEHQNVIFIRKYSADALTDIPKEVDFIYIDGNHNYEYVLGDLHNYFPLVRSKGVIAGHDVDWPPVKKAVDDFCLTKNITPLAKSPDWIILK